MVTSVDLAVGMSRNDILIKRSFDVFVSFVGLILTWPIIVAAWLVATIDTRQNGFFTQPRVGLNGNLFKVIKIRTMVCNPQITTTATTSSDPRITVLGRFFRKAKIDELPQLINVFLGDMSLVGPRPDVPGFADKLEGDDRIVLSVRPGITGPATLAYRNEEELLQKHTDPELYNREFIFPEKLRINKEYIKNYSFITDIKYIFLTLFT